MAVNINERNEESKEIRIGGEQEVSVAVITYNGMNVIKLCLESIFAQTYRPFRVFLINNASTDGTSEWVRDNYPEVEVLNYPKNRGPNPARNLAIRQSKNRLVLLVDDDAVLEKDCLSELVKAAKTYPEAAVWSPRIIYFDNRDVIQFEGVFLHYIGEAILLNGETSLREGLNNITPIDIAGGVSYLVSRDAAISIGLFDEDYFFGRTDGEFTFRLTLAGYKLYTVPKAACYHRVKKRGLSKVFYQTRNRWYLILSTYSLRTLVFLMPALSVYEMSLVLFLSMKRRSTDYVRGVSEVIVNLPLILAKRKAIQSTKIAADRNVLYSSSINIRSDLIEHSVFSTMKSILDRLFRAYWKLIYRIL